MANRARKMSPKGGALPKVAVACQGGGMHAGFEIGVLSETSTSESGSNS